MTEFWKRLEIDQRYEVSDLGNIRFNGRGLEGRVGSHGYLVVYLRKPTGARFLLHRLVCEAFHGASEKETVNHIDGNKLNNSVGNLEWATYAENNRHGFRTGLMKMPPPSPAGEANPKSKLSSADIIYIRENPHRLRGTQLAEKFGVSTTAISAIRTGKSWARQDLFPAMQNSSEPIDYGFLKKKVVRDDGVVFDSVNQAAQSVGVSACGISSALSGIQKTSGGHGWRWHDDSHFSRNHPPPSEKAERR